MKGSKLEVMKTVAEVTEADDFAAKVIAAVNRALYNLVKNAAANDEYLITGDKDGNAKAVPAKEILKTLSE